MYWIAINQNNETIVLTEREALVHFERNNVSNRMRLRFLGTTTGENTKQAKQKIKQMIAEKRPTHYNRQDNTEQNMIDADIREEILDEISRVYNEALKKDIEDAKKNGIKRPRKELHVHTISKDGHSRQEILGQMQSML